MKNAGTLKVVTQGEREVLMTRVFDAPRELVFAALTKSELLKRWFGPREWTLTECEIDLRVGGAWRFLSHGPNGRTMGMRGVYREIVPSERLQYTESFDDFVQYGDALVTATLEERDGRTTLTNLILSPSRDVRDAVIRSGMSTARPKRTIVSRRFSRIWPLRVGRRFFRATLKTRAMRRNAQRRPRRCAP